jgi:hypothetical protein
MSCVLLSLNPNYFEYIFFVRTWRLRHALNRQCGRRKVLCVQRDLRYDVLVPII